MNDTGYHNLLWSLLVNCCNVTDGVMPMSDEVRQLCEISHAIYQLVETRRELVYDHFSKSEEQDRGIYVAICSLVHDGTAIAKKLDRKYDPADYRWMESSGVLRNENRNMYQKVWADAVDSFCREYLHDIAIQDYEWYDEHHWNLKERS